MNTYRFVAVTTVAAFAALVFLVPGRDALSADPAASPTGPPGLVVSGKPPGWFELRATPVSVDDQPVANWAEVNAALHRSGHEVVDELQRQTSGKRDTIPDKLDGGTFAITIRTAERDGSPVEQRITVRRWFPKRSLFSRACPTESQRFEFLQFEIQRDDPHLN